MAFFGRKKGVSRKIFDTFFCVFWFVWDFICYNTLTVRDKRWLNPSKKNRAKNRRFSSFWLSLVIWWP
jgi:hypothetical protein